jgi:hypothetical protein
MKAKVKIKIVEIKLGLTGVSHRTLTFTGEISAEDMDVHDIAAHLFALEFKANSMQNAMGMPNQRVHITLDQ